jgi:ribosomal protein S18 acetylase RimI-like enzyme
MPDTFDFVCPAPLAAQGYRLRRESATDEPALRALYIRHRWNEFAVLPMDDTQKLALLDNQYTIQHRQYETAYANPRVFVLTRDGVLCGRLMLGETEGCLRILDILIEPAFRGRRLGSALLAGLIDQAGASNWCVTLHVDKTNRAQRLYARLGFVITGDAVVAYAMACPPPQGSVS